MKRRQSIIAACTGPNAVIQANDRVLVLPGLKETTSSIPNGLDTTENDEEDAEMGKQFKRSSPSDSCPRNSSEIITESPYALHGIKLIPEGEWGWAVCTSGFIIQFVVLGVHNSFGILFAFLLNEFEKSKAATAWVGSAAVGILYLFGPITCGLNERIGFRATSCIGGVLCGLGMLLSSFVTELPKIFVTYSLLWGIGSSLCYFSTLSVPSEYFCEKLSLANGIITAGSGFGTLTFGPVLQHLLNNYGLATTLRILSAIMCILVLASLTYKRFLSPLEQLYDVKRPPAPFCDMTLWNNKGFVLYTAAVSLFMLGYFIPYVHVVSLVVDLGISASDGAMLIGYMSISSTVGRIFFGKFSDHPRVNRLYMTQFAIAGFGVTTMFCPIVKTYPGFIAVMIVLGLFDGIYVVLIAVVVTDIVGVHKLNQALGNLYGVISFTITAGPPFAGFIYDSMQSYNSAFYICGATTLLSSLLMFLIPWLVSKNEGRFVRDSIDSRLDSLLNSTNSRSLGFQSSPLLEPREKRPDPVGSSSSSGLIHGGDELKKPKENSGSGCSDKNTSEKREDEECQALGGVPGARCGLVHSNRRNAFCEDYEGFVYDDDSQCSYAGVDDLSLSSSSCENSFNTSQNTSYNSAMFSRGFVTKALLAHRLNDSSANTSTESFRNSSPRQMLLAQRSDSPVNTSTESFRNSSPRQVLLAQRLNDSSVNTSTESFRNLSPQQFLLARRYSGSPVSMAKESSSPRRQTVVINLANSLSNIHKREQPEMKEQLCVRETVV